MQTTNHNRTLIFGIVIILAGLFILLDQIGALSEWVSDIIISWQMLLIAIGVVNLASGNGSSRIFGFILIVVGGFFLLPEIFFLPYNFGRNFWPVLLILLGVFLLLRAGFNRHGDQHFNRAEVGEADFIDELNIFSGSEKRINTVNFKGGKITSIFGGSEIDLTNSELSEGKAILELFYVFGGSSLRVPDDWVVINNVTPILGGFSDKRNINKTKSGPAKNTLVLNGIVIFGGGEIKS